jgi:hypothetical protein
MSVTDLNKIVNKARQDLERLIKIQNKKIRSFFIKSHNGHNNNVNDDNNSNSSNSNNDIIIADKLLMIAADIQGLREQINVLNHFINLDDNSSGNDNNGSGNGGNNNIATTTHIDKLAFINDHTDLDIDNEQLKELCCTRNLLYFSTRYNAMVKLNNCPLVYDYFLQQSERFINEMANLLSKQQEDNYCLEELVKIKSFAIKHLCTLEHLVEATT